MTFPKDVDIVDEFENSLIEVNNPDSISFLWEFLEESPHIGIAFETNCGNGEDVEQLATLLASDLNTHDMHKVSIASNTWRGIRSLCSNPENGWHFWIRSVSSLLERTKVEQALVVRCCDSHAVTIFLDTETLEWCLSRFIPGVD